MTLSFAKRVERGDDRMKLFLHAARRAAIIFALGLLLNFMGKFSIATLRIPGVLQRIAVCYLIAAAIYFHHTAIVKEKDPEAYGRLVEGLGFDAKSTWMVGNSPKSDINPALAIGLNAVFIPHVSTWTLEREQIRSSAGRLLHLESFRELSEHF